MLDVTLRHPIYWSDSRDWLKWRYAYESTREFIDTYMVKLTERESTADFNARKAMAYVPGFAAAAIDDIKNAIFQRTADVIRTGGPPSYSDAVSGIRGGVDLKGSKMGMFVGESILTELLVMSKVGLLVDNHADLGRTMLDKGNKRPYVSAYKIENILSWAPDVPVNGYTSVLLREVNNVYTNGLPSGTETVYRHMEKIPEGVLVTFYAENGEQQGEPVVLELDKIPFTCVSIPRSLMMHVADYQIALMNLESADISYAMKSNFPFYYEYFDPVSENRFVKSSATNSGTGTAAEAKAKDREVTGGSVHGRGIPKGYNPPGFINPNPETLLASMKKGSELKEDIRKLVNLNVLALSPRKQSAEGQQEGNRPLEASLSYIGLNLERMEQQLSEFWADFEGYKGETKINYPKTYSLKDESERRGEAKELEELADVVPSSTFRKEMKKKIARTLIGADVLDSTMVAIQKEIDDADVLTSDPNIIITAHESGLVDDETASLAIGFKKGVIEQARKDRAERLRLVLESQGGAENANAARGIPEAGGKDGVDEKKGKKGRGEADEIPSTPKE